MDDRRWDLCRYRIEQARESLKASEIIVASIGKAEQQILVAEKVITEIECFLKKLSVE